MKISEPSWYDKKKVENQVALDNPMVGDYWNEMFCPYFLIVHISGDKYTVLCAFPEDSLNNKETLCARIFNKDDTWSWDYTKHSVVTKEWITKTVTYGSIPGFVADVWRSEKQLQVVEEWREVNPNYKSMNQYAEWWLGV